MVIGIALSVLLVGCSSSPAGGVRVVDRNGNGVAQRPTVTTGQYVVRRGDTLFSIACRYGWDWKALAARNQIPEPFTIKPGQTIRFDGRSSSTPSVVSTSGAGRPVTSTSTTTSSSGSVKTTVMSKPV
ncbi:LysM domain-containing protein, partial [Pseudomonas syringae]